LTEVLKPDESRIYSFWMWFQEAWLKLYGSSFPTAALVSGHAIAGGCVWALSCEYRVMLPNFNFGLNETVVGIVPPHFVNECARNVRGTREAELALTLGTLFTSEEALKHGWIDELATDKEDAKARCEKFLQKFSKIPTTARALTKQSVRRSTLELLKNPKSRSEDAKQFVGYLLRPSTQNDIETYLASIKTKKN
jgi:Delta3-Delta2-enoyl-CoA isomerase